MAKTEIGMLIVALRKDLEEGSYQLLQSDYKVFVRGSNGYGVTAQHLGDGVWDLSVTKLLFREGWTTLATSNITRGETVLTDLDVSQVAFIASRVVRGMFVPRAEESTKAFEIPGRVVRPEPTRTWWVQASELREGDTIYRVLSEGFAVVNPNRV